MTNKTTIFSAQSINFVIKSQGECKHFEINIYIFTIVNRYLEQSEKVIKKGKSAVRTQIYLFSNNF